MADPGSHSNRRASRIAAVQALYQMELTGDDADLVRKQFCEYRFADTGKDVAEADADFFSDLVSGVPQHQVAIDRTIAENLSQGWRLQRIDSILRAILRAAVYELMARRDVPAKAVIHEYLEVAHAFFGGEEPGFVNALLDRVAHVERPTEFGRPPRDDELRF